MPRPHRATPAGYCYHVLNRGNARQRVFRKDADYAAFVNLFDEAQVRCPMRILAYCLMPNHFHVVLWPREDGDVSRWMQWVQTTHVRRYHELHRTSGHVWQGRFKAFPIQQDEHLLAVLRYVERNPLRAGLVRGVNDWPWNSLRLHDDEDWPIWYSNGPVPRGSDWPAYVAEPQTDAELVALRRSADRGTPFGGNRWQKNTVTKLGLESTLRNRGRPRKPENEA
ncbi:MAG: transposase [Pirellulaceae bacterium]|jgi:putative transposase|nr:transposase [Pirellulaceae bacterium]